MGCMAQDGSHLRTNRGTCCSSLPTTPVDSGTRCAIFRRHERRMHRTVAALAALSFAAMSSALLKAESDTWWHRRCDSHKPGCGGAPPLIPFTAGPSE